ncbi:tetratricopeptide repeat protein [Bacteroidota bacterium]
MKRLVLFSALLVFFTLNNVDAQKYGDSPEDSIKCVTQFSLYFEDYKLWREGTGNEETFKVMSNSWKYVLLNCPEISENIYIHGVYIIRDYLEKAPDKETRYKYVDTLMMIYDQRVQYFPEKKGDILCRKGVDLIKLKPSANKEAYEILEEGIEIEGNNSSPGSLYYFMVSAISMVKGGKADSSIIIETYDKVSDIFDYNISNNPTGASGYEKILKTVEQISADFLICKDIIRIYNKKFEEQPDNLLLVKKITKLLDKKDCTDSELFFKTTEVRHRLEPTAYTAYLMATMNYKKEDFAKSSEYAKEASQLYEDNEGKIRSYLLLAESLKIQSQYAGAKSAASKAIELDPDNGKAYLLLGDIYVAGAKTCGDNEVTSKVGYWAASDKYVKARSVDSEIENIANEKIANIKKYFPDKNNIFFYNLTIGDPYRIDCWINETTTVRSSN